MPVFGAAPHADVLTLLIDLAVLLFAARLFGELAQRLGQPAVVGELLAGIAIGPSGLCGAWPWLHAAVMPQTPLQGHLLEVVSLLGAMFLLLVTGLETDLLLIREHARVALGVAAGGLVVPLLAGYGLGIALPDRLLGAHADRTVFALFVATAMSISAIPVIAKVLMDLNLMRRDIGQTIVAAGMIDDATGWVLLSVVASLARGETVTAAGVGRSVASVLGFLAFSLTGGLWLARRAVDLVHDRGGDPDRMLSLAVTLMFAWGAVSHGLHLEPVFGAFAIGIVLGRLPHLPASIHEQLKSIALGIFAPIFFAVAGLKVSVGTLLHPGSLAMALAVIAVATAGKLVGAYAGARAIGGRDHWTALAYGAGLNARGAMEIIVASIGLSLGILSQEMFSIVVVMAMATSIMAPTALRRALERVELDPRERARLERETLDAGSSIGTLRRVLLPVRRRSDHGPSSQTVLAPLLERIAQKSELTITIMTVAGPGEREACAAFVDEVAARFAPFSVLKKVVDSAAPADVILEEAQKGYQLLLLGASEADVRSDVLFTPLADYVVRGARCLTMLVQARAAAETWRPRRILVPTGGKAAARRAAELAFLLASAEAGDEVTILSVAATSARWWSFEARRGVRDRQLAVAEKIVGELRDLGRARGIATEAVVESGGDPETAILRFAERNGIDLILLGTDLRSGSDRLFFGPRIEQVLERARCPVVIVNSP